MYLQGFEFDPSSWSEESYEVSKDIYDVGNGILDEYEYCGDLWK